MESSGKEPQCVTRVLERKGKVKKKSTPAHPAYNLFITTVLFRAMTIMGVRTIMETPTPW